METITYAQVVNLPASTLAELKATPIVGNAYHDSHIFVKVEKFVHNESNSIADRAEALRWMSDKVMGCDRCEYMDDIALVHDYINNA